MSAKSNNEFNNNDLIFNKTNEFAGNIGVNSLLQTAGDPVIQSYNIMQGGMQGGDGSGMSHLFKSFSGLAIPISLLNGGKMNNIDSSLTGGRNRDKRKNKNKSHDSERDSDSDSDDDIFSEKETHHANPVSNVISNDLYSKLLQMAQVDESEIKTTPSPRKHATRRFRAKRNHSTKKNKSKK
jgi:hypothetical protein